MNNKFNFGSMAIPVIVIVALLIGGSSYLLLAKDKEAKTDTEQLETEMESTDSELESSDDVSSDTESSSSGDTKTEETDDVPDKFTGSVTLEQARTIAQNRRPGKTIKKVEQEVEEGVGVYSVRFTDSGRVDVNAVTGEIMRVEAGDGE